MSEPIRPIKYLRIATEFYPDIDLHVDSMTQRRGRGLSWPEWCYLPLSAWQVIVRSQRKSKALPSEVARIAALGTWRVTQGIYRLNDELMTALLQSNIFGNLPSDVLLRLPDNCIYIETPGFKWLKLTLHGYWAHREWNADTEKPELRLLLDSNQGLVHLALPVGAWTVIESVKRTDDRQSCIDQLNRLLLPLLYICSENTEVKQCEQNLKVRDDHKLWLVGCRLGEKLYNAIHCSSMTRKGHWHGYWSGSRAGEKQFVFRWISPVDQ